MRKLFLCLFLGVNILNIIPIQAGFIDLENENNKFQFVTSVLSKAFDDAQTGGSIESNFSDSIEIRNFFAGDDSETSYSHDSKIVEKSKTYSTWNIGYYYDNSGWLYQCAIYSDGVAIGTSAAGPNKGFQIILMPNGSYLDSSNSYKEYKKNITHRYSWGEVNTYENYQTLKLK
jgi:hypothetical protein